MKRIVLAGGVAALIGSLAISTFAQDALSHLLGFHSSHLSFEKYDLSVGVSALGVPLRHQPREDFREQLNYPEFYGSFLGMTPHGDKVVFWFQDSAGTIRNAVVDAAPSRLYRLEKMPDRKLTVAVVRDALGK